MQNTRLNTLVDAIAAGLGSFFQNPWRRTSLLIISVLLGNFLGTAISTVSGQRADWDIVVAAFLVLGTELVSRIAYGGRAIAANSQRVTAGKSLPVQLLNTLKIGMTYNLFVEAFKLGS